MDRWRRYTQSLVASGQLAKYREFCAKQLRRHGQTDDPATAKSLIHKLLIGPDAVDDWSLPLRLSQIVLSSEDVSPAEKAHVSALLCRAGEYERSLKLRAEVNAETGGEPLPLDSLWQAMAHHGLGNIVQARELASKARELAGAGFQPNGQHQFEILFRELTEKLNESPLPPGIGIYTSFW